MNRQQMLLVKLMEECNEVAQRASKCINFTMEEIQPDNPGVGNNAERMMGEFNDLFAIVEMLHEEGHVPFLFSQKQIEEKKIKVEKYLLYSKDLGVYKPD